MELFLVQHGESMARAEDPRRPLTDAGVECTRRMAALAGRLGIQVEEIRHSGKRRARETAEIFGGLLQPRRGVNAVQGLEPNDDVECVADALASRHGSLMLVGHMPFLSRLAGLLLAGRPDATPVRFVNAGIVCLVREKGKWSLSWSAPPDFAG